VIDVKMGVDMAWGKKKKRELEYRKTGQTAALKPGDLGAKGVYEDDETEFMASWELESDLTGDHDQSQ
jgi:hypothetical protein